MSSIFPTLAKNNSEKGLQEKIGFNRNAFTIGMNHTMDKAPIGRKKNFSHVLNRM